jgi:hypothetical protein
MNVERKVVLITGAAAGLGPLRRQRHAEVALATRAVAGFSGAMIDGALSTGPSPAASG